MTRPLSILLFVAVVFVTKTGAAQPPGLTTSPQSVKFFLHGHDIPKTAGSFTMNPIPAPPHLLALSLASAPSWLSDPELSGTFASGAQFSVTIPCTLGLGLVVTFRLASTDLNGGNEQSLGSVSTPLSLCTDKLIVNVPVNSPLTLDDRRLKLVISTLLAVNLNLQLGSGAFVEGTNFVETSAEPALGCHDAPLNSGNTGIDDLFYTGPIDTVDNVRFHRAPRDGTCTGSSFTAGAALIAAASAAEAATKCQSVFGEPADVLDGSIWDGVAGFWLCFRRPFGAL